MHFRNPDTVHAPLASYTHQIEVPPDARWLVLSGQIGQKPDGSVPTDPADQLRVALENVRLNLQAANMDIGDLVKLTFYLVGEMDSGKRRDIIQTHMGTHRPCMTLLHVSALATPEYHVEIDALAAAANF